jgi:ParB family transcriptional regulator, chromosome partitioning protein
METDMNTSVSEKIAKRTQQAHNTVTKSENLGYEQVSLELIDPDPENIRIDIENDPDIEGLVADIKRFGVLQPISLSRVEERFMINFGHRRVRAANLAGHKTIPAIIVPAIPRDELAWKQYSENDKRLAMTRYEKTIHAIKRMCNRLALSEEQIVAAIWAMNEGKSVDDGTAKVIDEILKRMDISLSTFAVKFLRTQKYPKEVIDAILKRRINENMGLALSRIENPELRLERLEQLADGRLSLLELEEELKSQGKTKKQEVSESDLVSSFKGIKIDLISVQRMPQSKKTKLMRLMQQINALLSK